MEKDEGDCGIPDNPIVIVFCPLCPWGVKTRFHNATGRFADHMKEHGDKAREYFNKKNSPGESNVDVETDEDLWNWAFEEVGDYAERCK